MIKLIKRKSDNKYLVSIENDIWVDNKEEALNMTYRECESIKKDLFLTIQESEILEIVDFTKDRPISEEEKQELLDLFKGKKN